MKVTLTANNPINEVDRAYLKQMEDKMNAALENLEVNLGYFGTHVTYVGADENGELLVEDRTEEILNERRNRVV